MKRVVVLSRRLYRRKSWPRLTDAARFSGLALVAVALYLSVQPSVARAGNAVHTAKRPNVVLVMTDDQGYGDLSCHGNPLLNTPALDALYSSSLRLTNFHVDPTCSPTRAALMTGRYSIRTGVWHTIMGRSILRKDERTMADLFSEAGYSTAIFGKWHLGDNAPYRPQDRGFQEVLIHGGGGIGQTPDAWGNDYFDDTYSHNGKQKAFTGYCTDVWFDGALEFIEANQDRPFFAYLPTNAAHGPFLVAERYSKPFRNKGVPSPRAEFYGMIVNIDENMARLERHLEKLGLADNTILIFMTDNGTAAGMRGSGGFNAGMRGTKGSQYEGGHRVPCFIRWPAAGIEGGRDVDQLAAHVDLLPTLIESCRLTAPANLALDGRSLLPLLTGRGTWKPRTLFVDSQRIEHPEKWRKSAVMTDRWRLIDGRELYDRQADPGQQRDIAAENKKTVIQLRAEYENWWDDVSVRFDEYVRIELGSAQTESVQLTCHDWHAPIEQVPWNQTHVKQLLPGNGFWAVDVHHAGRYEFTLRTRPLKLAHPLKAKTARVKCGNVERSIKIAPKATFAQIVVPLPKGPAKLQTWLETKERQSRGAYFVDVTRLD